MMVNAMDLIDAAIADLEGCLNLQPGEIPHRKKGEKKGSAKPKTEKKKAEIPTKQKGAVANENQPDICKLEFKVGVITKVWVHPDADKLYCEEIDVGEEVPRQIASGLRPHFSEEQMIGQRLLVASNLKAKNLVGFKSYGMVLCAAEPIDDENEKVEFVEPPEGAAIGEIVTFEGLPPPEPFSPAQVDKKKAWQKAADGMKTTEGRLAAWNGHVFMTSAGPCQTMTIAGGVMR